MNSKRLVIFTLVIATMAMFAGMVVNAQGGRNGGRGGAGGRGFDGQSDIILEATGLTSAELRTAVQGGSTIVDLITANDGDVNAIISELVAEATTNINEKVADGSITQAQADERIAELETRITERLNGTFERPEGRGGRGGHGFDGQSDIILEATGLTSDELRTALQGGATIADLITANDGDVNAVISELVAEATTNINEKVADGSITQAQADERIAELETRITERLNGTFERPEGRGGRGGRGFGNGDTTDAGDTTEDA